MSAPIPARFGVSWEDYAALKAQNQKLRRELQTYVDHGQPLREPDELWSTWQSRVRDWKAASAVLAALEAQLKELKSDYELFRRCDLCLAFDATLAATEPKESK